MSTWHSRMLVAAGWLYAATVGAAQAAPPSSTELRAWLTALDAEDYAAREAASDRLISAGEVAIAALAEGVSSSSPEAAWRASIALEQIALRGDEQTLTRVSAALEQLSQTAKPGLSHVARELKAKQARLRHDRAVSRVRSLGGRFSGEGEEFSVAGGGFFGGAMPAVVEVIDEVVAEKIAGDVAILAEAGEGGEVKALELPAELKAFEDALKLVEAVAGKPAALTEKEPAPPPDTVPAEPIAPPAPRIADAAPVPDAPAVEAVPAAVVEGVEIALGDIVFGDAIGIDFGFAIGDSVDAEPAAESLALDKNWTGGDAGLAVLRDLPSIVTLQIADARLTDAALPHIAALPRLSMLDLRGTVFTAAGLRKFRQQRPATRIYARGDAMLGVNADLEGPCVLSSVYYGSGAYEAGLAQGDEIIAVDGHKVADFSDLTIAVFTHKPGEKLKVEFKRGGELKSLNAVLKDRKLVEQGNR